jgi:hypothetical protein
MIARRLHAVYFPPDNTPVPAEQIELLLALRRKERESRRPEWLRRIRVTEELALPVLEGRREEMAGGQIVEEADRGTAMEAEFLDWSTLFSAASTCVTVQRLIWQLWPEPKRSFSGTIDHAGAHPFPPFWSIFKRPAVRREPLRVALVHGSKSMSARLR